MSTSEEPTPEVRIIDLTNNPIITLSCGCVMLGMALWAVLCLFIPPARPETLITSFAAALFFAWGLGVTIYATVSLARKRE